MSGYEVTAKIRAAVEHLGPILLIRAYCDARASSPRLEELRAELQSSGVTVVHCSHSGRKDQVDKMIIGLSCCCGG